jgi:DNA (cytosine-5)-methyltransferase 1
MRDDSARPIAVDLFAGAGGLSLGFEQAGFDIAAAVEWDPIHCAAHKLNFPYSTVICGDVKTLTGESIRKVSGIGRHAIDVVIGGPPCQGFSLIGHRVLNDPRNSLVLHFSRLVEELRPKTFVMENVPGMATGGHTQVLEETIERFQKAGYRVRLPYRTLNAAHFGVPQNRPRLFLLGARGDSRLPDYPTPRTKMPPNGKRNGYDNGNGHRAQWTFDFGLPESPTVEDAIGDLPNLDKHAELFETDVLRVALRGGSAYARLLRGESRDPKDFSYPRRRDSEYLTGCLLAEHTAASRRRFGATAEGATEPISRFYRLPWEGVSNTLRAGTATDRGAFSAARPIHPEAPRCITVREAARLHSYPDWFRFHRTIWHGFRQIGNSVPPLLARAVGTAVIDSLGYEPIRPKTQIALGSDDLAAFDMREAAAFFGVSPTVIAPRVRAKAQTRR